MAKYVNTHMRSVCAASRITSGMARVASSQSFKVIIAIPRKSERLIPPRSFISPIWIVPLLEYSVILRISAAASIAPI